MGLGALAFDPDRLNYYSDERIRGKELRLGNLFLTPIITEHDEETWSINGDEILSLISEFPVIIPEYFPPDYEAGISDSPLVDFAIDNLSQYNRLNSAFDYIEEFVRNSNKEIWVVDPAYSEAFVKMRLLRNSWMPVLGTTLSSPFAFKAVESVKKIDSSKPIKAIENILEALFSGSVALAGMGSTVLAYPSDITPMGFEQDLRHTFIAEGLEQLGNISSKPTKAATIYPSGHWYGVSDKMPQTKGILYYLENPDQRRLKFEYYCEKFNDRLAWEDFFQVRNYQVQNNKWIQKSGFKLAQQDKS